ncbi:MAG: PilW family protein, partial [Saezia sp.]
IMLAIALSALVVAALLMNLSNSAKTNALQREYASMLEEGQYALSIMSNTFMSAGFMPQTEVDPGDVVRKRFPYIQGCSNWAFKDSTAWAVNTTDWGEADDWGALGAALCGAGEGVASATSDSIAVRTISGSFECGSGGGVTTLQMNGKSINVASSYLSVQGGVLMCGKEAIAPVAQVRLWYGEGSWVPSPEDAAIQLITSTPTNYKTADQVVDWRLVSSVRICLLVKSRNPVNVVGNAGNQNCNGTPIADDKFLYRTLFTTIDIPNAGNGF